MASVPAAEVPLARRLSISARFNRAKPHAPPTLTMVMEAVKSLNEKKGSSAIAIRQYILNKYPGVDPIRLKYYLKKALAKGLDKGYLIRPLNSTALGATGRFKLVTEKSKQGKAKMVDGETASKPAKKKAIAAVKKPKSKAPAEKPRSKILTGKPGNADPEGDKKKPKIAESKTEGGNKANKAPAKPKEKPSADKTAKATKKRSAPEAPQAKLASGSKTKKEGKGPAKSKAKEGSKPPSAEKAKATGDAKDAETKDAAKAKPDAAKAKPGGSGTKTKPAAPKTKKPEPKKGATKGKGKKEAASFSDSD